jgi:hypothetical protein
MYLPKKFTYATNNCSWVFRVSNVKVVGRVTNYMSNTYFFLVYWLKREGYVIYDVTSRSCVYVSIKSVLDDFFVQIRRIT